MARNHSYLFEEADADLAAMCKALSHPARVQILRVLAQRSTCVCGDIVAELPLAQATVSQHLKELKQAGLIQGTIDGAKVCYCINPDGWQKARDLFNNIVALEVEGCC